MVKTTEYFEFAKKEFPKLRLLTAAIVMQHGANHPELKEVPKYFRKLIKQLV
jgi:iron-sulfur cluster repair protein YtfE (RIC family)